jgi:hypothetical protein
VFSFSLFFGILLAVLLFHKEVYRPPDEFGDGQAGLLFQFPQKFKLGLGQVYIGSLHVVHIYTIFFKVKGK